MGHWEYDMKTGMFTFNDQYFTLHNVTQGEVKDFRMTAEEFTCKYIHPDDAHLVMDCIQKAAKTENDEYQHQIEARILCANGEVRMVAIWFRVEKDAQGRTIKMHGVSQDITKRKQAEEELKRLSTAIEQAAEEVIVTGIDGIIQYVNPAFEKITGYSRADVIGQTPGMLKSGIHDKDFYKNLWDTITAGKVWTGRITNKRKDG